MWLAIGGLAGYIAANLGGHASGIFLLIGALVGVSGALWHAALRLVRRSRRSSWLAQTIAAWCGTMVLSVGAGLCLTLVTGHAADTGAMVEKLLLFAGLPALLASGFITWAVDLAA